MKPVWITKYLFLLALLPVAMPLGAQINTSPDANPLLASDPDVLLPVDEAFAFDALIEAPSSLVLLWEMPPGYYLYRKSLTVSDGNGTDVTPDTLPAAISVNDEFFGEVKVYYDRLILRLPLADLPTGQDDTVTVEAGFQGCAADRFCYPPQRERVTLALP